MNKRINQLINQLHLDPKKEAAVREIVENAISNNQNGDSNSGGSEPVIIEYSTDATDSVSITDKQINAAKNYNIILNMIAPNGSFMLVPYGYIMDGENIGFLVRAMNGAGHISDAVFSIDVINKTITLMG